MRGFLVAWLCLAGMASAEPLSEREARGQLFGVRGDSVVFAEGLSEAERGILREVIRLSAEQMRQPLSYYAAIAYAPEEGLVSGSLQSAINHHGVAAADAAALGACTAAKTVSSGCRVAARVVPRGYERRALELSLGATVAFRETYRAARGERALAISPSSGSYAVATGAGAAATALARCNAASGGSGDCRVAIAD